MRVMADVFGTEFPAAGRRKLKFLFSSRLVTG
jgi:hypothetical protein